MNRVSDRTAPRAGAAVRAETVDPGRGSSTQHRSLLTVWLAAGSAIAYTVAVGWIQAVSGGLGFEMRGHAAVADWFSTLAWWDWRGWSGWFYGGQAFGVNYPPLGHVWLRLTHPVHGQMAAVAIGLLLLLPWGALTLARAVGFSRRRQCAAVASALCLAAWSAEMSWTLSSFHFNHQWGTWPKMLAPVVGMFAAALAARGRSPLDAGVIVGVATLLNASVVPGIAVICAVLVGTSGLRLFQALRWAATAAAAAVAVSAWWLVPFVAGWRRLVPWDVALPEAVVAGGVSGVVVLAVVAVLAAVAASLTTASKRLALAAAACLAATAVADLVGYLRPERWLAPAILVAAVAAAGAVPEASGAARVRRSATTARLAGSILVAVLAVVFARLEALALAVAVFTWQPGRVWVWGAALAWLGVLLWVPVSSAAASLAALAAPAPEQRSIPEPDLSLASAAAADPLEWPTSPDLAGSVYFSDWYPVPGGVALCADPFRVSSLTDGRVPTLSGLYRDTSASAEFIEADFWLRAAQFSGPNGSRPHWSEAWSAAGRPSLDTEAAAGALGARWLFECSPDGTRTVMEGSGVQAEGVEVRAHGDEDAWHKAAVEWWVTVASESEPLRPDGTARIPVLWPDHEVEGEAALADRAARGVSLHTEQDRLFVMAESAGWAWLRVPWDPWWFGSDGVPLKGGPGHLVVWVEPGVTELRWDVPAEVDATAVAVTALSLLLLVVMARINRREGWEIDPDRPAPAADSLNRFADEADRRLVAAGELVRSGASRRRSGQPPNGSENGDLDTAADSEQEATDS